MLDIQGGQEWYTQESGEHKAQDSTITPGYIGGMNDHLLRSLQDRYNVIED